MRGLPENTPVTAVIAGNDELAAGVIAGAHSRGWKIPDHLSVSGWDNNPVGAFMPPALTTVDVDHASLGRAAMKRLIARLRSSEPVTEPRKPLNSVIWRASVATPRAL
ncbi:substrate-binding domain-containing protein [Microbacterium saperdae]